LLARVSLRTEKERRRGTVIQILFEQNTRDRWSWLYVLYIRAAVLVNGGVDNRRYPGCGFVEEML
jgi:hypothetical protein